MRKLAIVLVLVLSLAITAQAQASRLGVYFKLKAQLAHSQHYLAETAGWEQISANHKVIISSDPARAYHRRVANRAWLAIRGLVPHKRQWLCIHRYEGSWQDPNPPYYGGLQMDLGFQRSYGGILLRTKGTAEHWTPMEQMIVAETAYYAGRGFHPWPNTARYCGLI